MEIYELYSGGRFLSSKQKITVTNKYSGEIFASTFLADEKLLDETIQAAIAAKEKCAALSSLEKFTALNYISSEIEKNKKHLAEVLCIESAKPMLYALGEIERAVQTFLIAAEESKRLPKEYMSLDWTSAGKNKEGIVKYFPVGIIAGISPFNFPLNLAAHKIAPAIAAGCPIILKPASATPLSTLELAKIISKTDLPDGAVSILPMNRTTGNKLVTDERIQLLSFTGSPEIGWELKKQSGKKKVVLELGGNAGVIVSERCPSIAHIISKCLFAAFSYSGQICIHAQRFYVHKKHFSSFLAAMKKGCEALIIGDPTSLSTQVSSMIDEDNAKRVETWVNEAVASGAKLVCGGKRSGSFFAPTILTGSNTTMKVNSLEVFGPVICIESYEGTIEDAVAKVNDSNFGLQCGLYTDSIEELEYCFNRIETGGVLHNEVPTLRFDQMPYGGIKDSGLGREGVRYAILDMLEPKILVK